MQQEQLQPTSQAGVTKKPESPQPIAPVWHTILILVLILGNSFLGSRKSAQFSGPSAQILAYAGIFIFESILVAAIWLGIRKRLSLRQLIGGRWDSVEAFLIDFAIAVAFMFVSLMLLAGLRIALGTLDLHHPDKQLEDTKRMLAPLIPHSRLQAALFVVLSVSAGFFEEIIFRGYLQRQIGALASNAWIGIVVSAAAFGAAHGYQGGRMMIVLGVYGAFFGMLAHFRRSLRPGIIAHALQDGVSGIILFAIARR